MTDKTPDERIGIAETEIGNLKTSDENQWKAINKLQNRLPIWATTIISVLTFFLGCSTTYAVMAFKLVGKSVGVN